MSGNKRRESLSQNNPFSLTEQTEPVTFKKADSELFGEIAKVDDSKLIAPSIPILQIYPNTIQPRRTLPATIRTLWDGEPQSLTDLFVEWANYVDQERQHNGILQHFDVQQLLLHEDTEDVEEATPAIIGPLEEIFLEIVDLAASIRRDGLLNPITAVHVRADRIYIIETGERRWLAYHLLASVFPNEAQWKRIPLRTVDHLNVWRQAAENSARQNLNAISRARQFSLLMMDLYRQESTTFQPPNTFEREQDFYAQVAAGDEYRIPRGKGEILLTAIGLKHGRDLKQLRAILRLPNEVWEIADYLNWTVGKLDQLTPLSHDDALRLACKMARQEGYMGEISPICDEPSPKQRRETTPKNSVITIWDKYSDGMKKITPKHIQSLSDDEKQSLRESLARHKAWINSIEELL